MLNHMNSGLEVERFQIQINNEMLDFKNTACILNLIVKSSFNHFYCLKCGKL